MANRDRKDNAAQGASGGHLPFGGERRCTDISNPLHSTIRGQWERSPYQTHGDASLLPEPVCWHPDGQIHQHAEAKAQSEALTENEMVVLGANTQQHLENDNYCARGQCQRSIVASKFDIVSLAVLTDGEYIEQNIEQAAVKEPSSKQTSSEDQKVLQTPNPGDGGRGVVL